MKVKIESFPGVVGISIEVESKEGNPLVLNWNRWSGQIPHLHNFVEHVPDEGGCECQYLDGLCYSRDVYSSLALYEACRDAQTVLGFTPLQITRQLLEKYAGERLFRADHEELWYHFSKFMATEIPEED